MRACVCVCVCAQHQSTARDNARMTRRFIGEKRAAADGAKKRTQERESWFFSWPDLSGVRLGIQAAPERESVSWVRCFTPKKERNWDRKNTGEKKEVKPVRAVSSSSLFDREEIVL